VGSPFSERFEIPIAYKNGLLDIKYEPDFICYDAVIVELKALERLSTKEQAHVINYLKATKIERALLINFGSIHLEFQRLILSH